MYLGGGGIRRIGVHSTSSICTVYTQKFQKVIHSVHIASLFIIGILSMVLARLKYILYVLICVILQKIILQCSTYLYEQPQQLLLTLIKLSFPRT